MLRARRAAKDVSTTTTKNGKKSKADGLALSLTVRDAEVVRVLEALPNGADQERFALQALRIGVLALEQASGHVDVESIRSEGQKLIVELQQSLNAHDELVNSKLGSLLKGYFDPSDGRFTERVDRLVQKDGDLERVLKEKVGQHDSELVRTLAAHVGEDSPLMRRLSPDDARGVLSMVRAEVESQLGVQREIVLKELSLDDPASALSRFRREVAESQSESSSNLQQQVERVVREFSLDEEGSALSRLVQNVERASTTIKREFSLDRKKSSLSRLQGQLVEILQRQQKDNREFQNDVTKALAEMRVEAQGLGKDKVREGCAFEELVTERVLTLGQSAGDIVTSTGSKPGILERCKVGDVVLELGPESAAPGARVVLEAKQAAGYTVQSALKELETAKKNRQADIGIFVWSTQVAPPGVEPMTRYGDDIVLVWDPDDSGTDVFLHAGVSLAKALSVRRSIASSGRQEIDLAEIDRALGEVENLVGRLSDVSRWAKTIKSNIEKILDHTDSIKKKLFNELESLRDCTAKIRDVMDKEGA